MDLNEIDQSLQTGELTLTSQEATDIDEAYDQLIAKQTITVSKHPDEPDEQAELERYTANQTLTVAGTIEITLQYIHDSINALNEKIYYMELIGENQSAATKYGRMQTLLSEFQTFLDDFVPAVSDKVALRRQVAGK